jgi:hypothetical protein
MANTSHQLLLEKERGAEAGSERFQTRDSPVRLYRKAFLVKTQLSSFAELGSQQMIPS